MIFLQSELPRKLEIWTWGKRNDNAMAGGELIPR